jgi:hypothetical protein
MSEPTVTTPDPRRGLPIRTLYVQVQQAVCRQGLQRGAREDLDDHLSQRERRQDPVKATVSGGTMTLENYSFGSTRGADDYVTAGKAAL